MPHSSFLRRIIPALLALSLLVLCGCTKSSRGTGLDNVAYTKSHTVVRIEPAPTARAVVSAGPNVRVTVLETKQAFSRISMDEGRVTGWVATSDLSDRPVKESAASRSPSKTPPKTSRPAASATHPATGDSSAPVQAPPVQAAEPAASPQAPQAATDSGPDGLLSPRSAQAAPPPADPAPGTTPPPPPARGKQANPDAFDPF